MIDSTPAPLRILMLCPQFRPLVGGYERAAERLARELVRQGQNVTVITDRRDPEWPVREVSDGFAIRRLRCLYRPRLHILTSILAHAAYLICRGLRFNIWHVHQYGSHATLAILLGKLARRPVVLKLTSTSYQSIARTLRAVPFSTIQSWAHRRMDACVAVSAEAHEEALAFGVPADRIVRISNGVDTRDLSPVAPSQRAAMRAQLGLPDRPVAIYVGRLAPEKNPLGLLDAWQIARTRFRQPWTLAFVGDGPLLEQVRNAARATALSDTVVVAGATEHVEQWLQAADLFVLSSHNEGMANTLLEAMACGLPSIVTAVSGMAELIAESGAGRIVPVGDAAAFAEALVALHDDPAERERMGMRAREKVCNRYSIESVAARTLALYRRWQPS